MAEGGKGGKCQRRAGKGRTTSKYREQFARTYKNKVRKITRQVKENPNDLQAVEALQALKVIMNSTSKRGHIGRQTKGVLVAFDGRK